MFNIRSVCITSATCTLFCWILTEIHYINNIDQTHTPNTDHCPNFTKQYPKTQFHDYVNTLLEMTRLKIKLGLWNYNFTYSDVDKLEDLVPDSGGTPIRSIIVSTWRSGSTFAGQLISAVPFSFHSYEPLMMFGLLTQIRGPPTSIRAKSLLKNILTCDYKNDKDIEKYWKYVSNYLSIFMRNKSLWDICRYKRELCRDTDFISKICKLFPFQTVKVNRLGLHFFKQMLEDKPMNVKIVLLVRDPRGVMHSRRQIKHFCSYKNKSDCAEVSLLCSDMVKNYIAAVNFRHQFPDRFMVLRYEDLAFNLKVTTPKLLEFLRLQPTASVFDFLRFHTNRTDSKPSSTLRISEDVPFKWKNAMNFSDVEEIQEKCRIAMSLWGYRLAQDAPHLASKEFNPLLPYSLK